MFYIYDGYSHRNSEMIQHGLSVSLNNSPRSPSTPTTPTTQMASATPGSPSLLLLAPSRRRRSNKVPVCPLSRGRLTFADIVVNSGVDGGVDGGGVVDDDGSVSPLVQRRLEFPLFDASPISMSSFRTNSSFPRFGASATRQLSLENSVEASSSSSSSSPRHIGECSVCYRLLPLRSNHIFTLCGHLFCVRCVLKWWDTNMTCPVCRADLFEEEEEDVAAGAAGGVAVEEEHSSPRIEDPASDSDESEEDDAEIQERPIIRGFTPLFRQYLQWGRFFEQTPPAPLWPQQEYGGGGGGGGNDGGDDIANFDDTRYCIGEVYALSFNEKARLRENRQIALNLFGRLVFREMLLSMMVEFSGDVRYSGDSVIPKDQWSNLFYYQAPHYLDTVNITMYEIVIRRGCDINVDNEMNMFGFIKEIRIISTSMNRSASSDDDSDDDDSYDYGRDREWENSHEYAFIADVFSPTNYYVQGDDGFHHMTPCGSYDMTEGTFSTVEIIIPFSNIRRLYSIRARERIEYGIIG